ncbi:hypothetical protein DH2020_017082 [Rehmannia glutinosa]|uniref:X8 domain-containing protein n=1 Tax=Rehmannia glutinosa TaxID=99300 RepID=A0ABR0WQ29_REHGL
MEKIGVLRLCILGLYLCFAAIWAVQCGELAGKHFRNSNTKPTTKFHFFRKFNIDMPLDSSNTDPYVSSPFSMAPYDSLPPISLPENTPPYCVYPPSTPQPPSIIPSPMGPSTPSAPPASSPESPPFSNPPTIIPSPPNPPINVPTPTEPVFSPPYYEPSPPSSVPSPPRNIPSPSGSVPSPRFLPPIVYPPPTVPPPPHRASTTALWCVAKASVPEPIIQEAMNYACGSGADCDQIQPSGSCFQPNTLFAHASYAFNSYWQRTKVTGGTCDFGGTALLVTVDPSYDGCHFIYF